MKLTWTIRLLLAAAAANGIATGATLDQAIKQLPARHDIGADAYADYVRAADLANGLVWYPVMGIGAAALSLAAVVVGLRTRPRAHIAALVTVAAGTVGHLATTAFAAPTLLTLRAAQGNALDTAATLDQFALLNALRATLMVATLAATVLALAHSQRSGPTVWRPGNQSTGR